MLGKIESILRYFNSLSTNRYKDHLILLGQFQKAIELPGFLLKKPLDVIVCLDTNIYLFIFLDLIFLFFDFLFLFFLDNEEICDHGHMIHHMIEFHKPKF